MQIVDLGESSMAEHLPCMQEALDVIGSTEKTEERKGGRKMNQLKTKGKSLSNLPLIY